LTDFHNSFTDTLTHGVYKKKLQTIYLMLYKRQIKNWKKTQKYKHERIR